MKKALQLKRLEAQVRKSQETMYQQKHEAPSRLRRPGPNRPRGRAQMLTTTDMRKASSDSIASIIMPADDALLRPQPRELPKLTEQNSPPPERRRIPPGPESPRRLKAPPPLSAAARVVTESLAMSAIPKPGSPTIKKKNTNKAMKKIEQEELKAWERVVDVVEELNTVRKKVKLIKMAELSEIKSFRTPPPAVVATMSSVSLLLGRERPGVAFDPDAHADLNTPEKLDYDWSEIKRRLGRPRNQFVNEIYSCDVGGILALPQSMARVQEIVATGELSHELVWRANKACGKMWDWVIIMLQLVAAHEQMDPEMQAQVLELARNPAKVQEARSSIIRTQTMLESSDL